MTATPKNAAPTSGNDPDDWAELHCAAISLAPVVYSQLRQQRGHGTGDASP